jgi:hypothetical protein
MQGLACKTPASSPIGSYFIKFCQNMGENPVSKRGGDSITCPTQQAMLSPTIHQIVILQAMLRPKL